MNKDDPREGHTTCIIVFIDKWSLFRGLFLYSVNQGLSEYDIYLGWSLSGGGL